MYNYAQVFTVSSSAVDDVPQVLLTTIDLYFYAKPKIEGNKSGIYAPGVEVTLVKTVQNSIPDTTSTLGSSRLSYNEIETSTSASQPTSFKFGSGIILETDIEYAFLIKFDGNEDFDLWKNKVGELLVNTNTVSNGSEKKNIGPFYIYANPLSVDNVLTDWKPLETSQLTFEVKIARYSHSGNLVSTNTSIINDPSVNSSIASSLITLSNGVIQIAAPANPVEYIAFDRKYSKIDGTIFGDYVYQSQPFYPGNKPTPATVNVTANSSMITCNTSYILSNGSNFGFDKMYSSVTQEYIIVTSLDHFGAGKHAVNVRKVVSSNSSTLATDEAFTFTNSSAYFYKSPVGRIYSKSRMYGADLYRDLIILNNSNANDSCKFVSNSIDSYKINAGGTSYNNNDVITITGYNYVANKLLTGYSASGKLGTNSTGGITSLYLSNIGAGFDNVANISYTFANSTGGLSSGSGANLSFVANSVLFTEFGNCNVYYAGCKVIDLEAMQVIPDFAVHNPISTEYGVKLQTLYYSTNDLTVPSNRQTYISNGSGYTIDVRNKNSQAFNPVNSPVLPSRSNMFSIPYANGALPNTSVIGTFYSNAAVYLFEITSNNDFASVVVNSDRITSYYSKYAINNDYTGEETNYGNAVAKHVSSKVNLENDQFAEDLLVYLTAYRPAGTDIQIYARIHNSHDLEAFDDKQWTRLECIEGSKLYSSGSNPDDMIELTYNFQAAPNTDVIISRSVTTTLNSAIVTGSNTAFSNTLATNDMVKIYQPLFPNNYIVGIVDTISNNTQLVLKSAISNNGIVGSGLILERLKYPLQAFNNITNDNVVRYYNSSKVEFDTFNTFQLKVVLLSNNDHLVPKIDDVKSVAVSS